MIQRLSFWIMMIVCSVMVSGQEYDGYYTNPILPSGADPWVVKHEGWYYYCCGPARRKNTPGTQSKCERFFGGQA